jgi:anaerobic selenocysteine-containing dehydrogenase
VRVLLLFGTDMLSSFADAGQVAAGLARTDLVVCHDLFMNDTARRFADVVLPSTSWLEEVGCKSTNTHLYLMDQALEPPGETRPLIPILKGLAARLRVSPELFPWPSDDGPLDAILDHPSTGHATVAALRAEGGIRPLDLPRGLSRPAPDTPSGVGLPERARPRAPRIAGLRGRATPVYPRRWRGGRSRTFTASTTMALPTLARIDPEARLWISPADAVARVADGARSASTTSAESSARAHVTDRISAGLVWMRDGWGLNQLTSRGARRLPTRSWTPSSSGCSQATFDAMVEVGPG